MRLSIGHFVGAVPAVFLAVDSLGKLLRLDPVVEGSVRLGFTAGSVLGLGILELACTLLYVVPRTSILGAIMLTGFLGGATATHVRVGDAFVFPVLVGVLIWTGPFLLDDRLRALVPLRGRARGGTCGS